MATDRISLETPLLGSFPVDKILLGMELMHLFFQVGSEMGYCSMVGAMVLRILIHATHTLLALPTVVG